MTKAAATTPGPLAIKTFIDVDKATADVTMLESNLSEEFVNQPGLFFYYASMFAKAERQHSDMKLRLEMTEAQAATKVRADMTTAGEKITEGAVKEKVRLEPIVARTEMALNEAKEVESTIKGLVEAFRHKKDMLIIRGNVSRDEFKAALTIGVRDHANDSGTSLRDRARQAAS